MSKDKFAKSGKSAKSAKAAKQSDGFIPDEATSSGEALYFKPQQGENTIRFISEPIFGWLEWVDKKPIRTTLDEEPEGEDEDNKPKKFMAAVIIDREDDNKVKIMELTQQSIIKAIKALAGNPKWGDPYSYDITINKSGEDLTTKYSVVPNPKSKLSKDVIKAANAKKCNLMALYDGENPWETEDGETDYIFG